MDAVNLTQRLNSRSISVSAQPSQKASWALRIQAVLVSIYDLVVIAVACYVLSNTSDSCEMPVRAWLITQVALCGVSLIINVCGNCIFSKFCAQGIWWSRCYKVMLYGFILLSFAWIVVGSVWIFEDSDCRNDWEEGYAVSISIVCINYLFVVYLLGVALYSVFCKK
jgi:hypothetical protein